MYSKQFACNNFDILMQFTEITKYSGMYNWHCYTFVAQFIAFTNEGSF